MAVEKGRAAKPLARFCFRSFAYAKLRTWIGIDLGKQTWGMAIITRSGKFRTNGQGNAEPEEKKARFSGTMAEGRLKLYGKLEAGTRRYRRRTAELGVHDGEGDGENRRAPNASLESVPFGVHLL
jgi:hypothetical protein